MLNVVIFLPLGKLVSHKALHSKCLEGFSLIEKALVYSSVVEPTLSILKALNSISNTKKRADE